MEPTPIPATLRATAPGLARQLGVILAALAALVARVFLRDPRHVALIIPLWTRLTRAARRFDRLMARLAAGTPSKPRQPGRSGSRPVPLPTGNGWLRLALRHEGAACATQLDHLLAAPETAALLAQFPQAARILRPICRMLGLRVLALPRILRPQRTTPAPPSALTSGRRPDLPPPPLAATAPSCPRARWPWFPRPIANPV